MPDNFITGTIETRDRIAGPIRLQERIQGSISTQPRISGPIRLYQVQRQTTPAIAANQFVSLSPAALRLAVAATTTTNISGDDVLSLITDLGGDAAVLAMYDVRAGITSSGGVVDSWDDYRGASGFAPALAQTGTARPAFTGSGAADWLVTFDGVDDRLSTGLSSLFDLSGAMSMILVGSLESAAATKLIASITAGGLGEWMAIGTPDAGANEYAGRFKDSTPETTPTTGIAVGTTRRVVLVGKPSGNGTWSIEVPNDAAVTGAKNAIPSANYELVLGALNGSSGIAAAAGTARACIVLNRLHTAGDVTTIKDWAVANHAAVLA